MCLKELHSPHVRFIWRRVFVFRVSSSLFSTERLLGGERLRRVIFPDLISVLSKRLKFISETNCLKELHSPHVRFIWRRVFIFRVSSSLFSTERLLGGERLRCVIFPDLISVLSKRLKFITETKREETRTRIKEHAILRSLIRGRR